MVVLKWLALQSNRQAMAQETIEGTVTATASEDESRPLSGRTDGCSKSYHEQRRVNESRHKWKDKLTESEYSLQSKNSFLVHV